MNNLSRLLLLLLMWLAAANAAFAFSTKELSSSVPANSQKAIQRFYLYGLGPCRGLPAPQWTSEGMKLGKVSAKNGTTKIADGPCGPDFEYPYLELIYNAGAVAGLDSFKIYIHNGAEFTPIPVKVTVGSGRDLSQNRVQREGAISTQTGSQKTKISSTKTDQVPTSKTWLLAMAVEQGKDCNGFSRPIAVKTDQFGQLVGLLSLNNTVWRLEGFIKMPTNFEIKATSAAQSLVIVGIFNNDIAKGYWKSGSCSGTVVLAQQ
jgi:hypothetical protein